MVGLDTLQSPFHYFHELWMPLSPQTIRSGGLQLSSHLCSESSPFFVLLAPASDGISWSLQSLWNPRGDWLSTASPQRSVLAPPSARAASLPNLVRLAPLPPSCQLTHHSCPWLPSLFFRWGWVTLCVVKAGPHNVRQMLWANSC